MSLPARARGVKPWFRRPLGLPLWYPQLVDYVVLEREFAEPLTPDDVPRMAAQTQCLGLYRVKPICSYLMPDGKRDAEALRAIARVNGFPPDSAVWSSTLHTP